MAFIPVDIFAQIIRREIDADIVYETERVIAFRDIAPKAKSHVLIVPKADIKTAKEISKENGDLFAELFWVAKEVALKEELEGYKLHMNVDEAGGQVVPHVHFHLLSPEYDNGL